MEEEELPPYAISLMLQGSQVALLAVKALTTEYCLVATEFSHPPWKEADFNKPLKLYDLVFEFAYVEERNGKKVSVYQFAGVREHAADC